MKTMDYDYTSDIRELATAVKEVASELKKANKHLKELSKISGCVSTHHASPKCKVFVTSASD